MVKLDKERNEEETLAGCRKGDKNKVAPGR